MTTSQSTLGSTKANPHRWSALVFVSIAQLMISVDSTIVNIALPSAQQELGMSDSIRQWVITAYLLAFGGLLLLGGKITDILGPKRALILGLAGFAIASAISGAAPDTTTLLIARALQGAFAALLAPAGLSILAATFSDSRERAKAFGIFSAIAGSGAAVGLIVGGALTEYLSWRWTLYVNVVFAVVVLAGAIPTVQRSKRIRQRTSLDAPGALLVSAGLVALVYGFTRADSDGWSSPWTLAMFAIAAILLALFVLVEKRSKAPLLPLRIVTDRNRASVFVSQALSSVTMFGLLLLLTYYLQTVQGFSPLVSGLAFLPMVAGMLVGASQVSGRLMPHVAPRWLMGPGFLIAAAGMLLLTQLEVGSSYLLLVLPAQALFGVGLGMAFSPALSLATTHRVKEQDTGVASAMINASQQVGGSIGAALLNTIAAGATASWLISPPTGRDSLSEATVHGYATAMWWAVGALVIASIVVFTFTDAARSESKQTSN
jgi:EmrB/QacA subfamily drug resistance transporter